MQLTKEYYEARKEAIEWLNGKREFNSGTRILIKSGYKPQVAAKIAKWGNISHSASKLEHEIRMMIRVWNNPDAPEHEDESQETAEEDKNIHSFMNSISQEQESDVLKAARIHCADLFNKRGVLRKKLIDLGEKNDPETIEERKQLIEQISSLSQEIDRIYKEVEAGEIKEEKEELPPEKLLTKEDLMRIKGNLKSSVTRTKNMLEYQMEKKGEEPNPMPEGPNRLKYETKLERLHNEINEIDYKLAAFG